MIHDLIVTYLVLVWGKQWQQGLFSRKKREPFHNKFQPNSREKVMLPQACVLPFSNNKSTYVKKSQLMRGRKLERAPNELELEWYDEKNLNGDSLILNSYIYTKSNPNKIAQIEFWLWVVTDIIKSQKAQMP